MNEIEVLERRIKVIRSNRNELFDANNTLFEANKGLREQLADLKRRAIKSLEWMIIDIKHRHDQTHGNLEEGSQGGYSEELTEAIAFLKELKDD